MFGAVVTFVGSVLLTVFNVYRVRRIWRDQAYFEQSAREFHFGFYSMPVRRGIVRGWLPFTLGFASLAVFGALNLYLKAVGGAASPDMLDLLFALILVTIVGFGLTLLVAWFNVPKLLVPPYLRGEPGAWAQRRQG